MSKLKIEVRKPQYLAAKELSVGAQAKIASGKTPFFFRLLMVSTYVLSGLAIWYVFQRFSTNS